MTFQEQLNQYITQLGCSAKMLSDAADLSPSLLSRYRSGKLIPQTDSEQLKRIAKAISDIAEQKQLSFLSYQEVLKALKDTLHSDFDAEIYAARINFIISELGINASSMAKSMGYDASFISRVRNGNRIPADLPTFTSQFVQYIVKNYDSFQLVSLLKKQQIEIYEDDISISNLMKQFTVFLMESSTAVSRQGKSFLQKLEEFDLNSFIRSLRFNPSTPPISISAPCPVSEKKYYGIEGNKQGELDFFQYISLSDTDKTITMCDDIDMENLTEDLDFSKKWLMLLASLLGKGVHFQIIHNLNRPFSELMLGLEAWIPLYMTGLVAPYYLKDTVNGPYQHLLYSSDSCVLHGDYIRGHHDKAKFTFTTIPEEAEYYKERSQFIMDRALPLMKIYTAQETEQFRLLYQTEKTAAGKRHYLTSMLPVFTLSDDFISSILQKQEFSDEEKQTLAERIRQHKADTETLLFENQLLHEMPLISAEEFESHPLMLDLTECGYPSLIPISYEDYLTYQKETENYASLHKNYSFSFNHDFPFRSIQIRILEGKWVWITKLQSPYIHFIIRHPKLRQALEQMCIPIFE